MLAGVISDKVVLVFDYSVEEKNNDSMGPKPRNNLIRQGSIVDHSGMAAVYSLKIAGHFALISTGMAEK